MHDCMGWQKGFGLGWGGVTALDHYTAKAVVLSVLIKLWGTIC